MDDHKSYLRNLIALASSDGFLDWEERILIINVGRRRGLADQEINELLSDDTPFDFFVPDCEANRTNLLYDLMQLVYADGKVTPGEVAFVSNVIWKLHLPAEVVYDILDLFENQRPAPTQWNDFMECVPGEESRFVSIL